MQAKAAPNGWTDYQRKLVAKELGGSAQTVERACEKVGVPEIEDMEHEILKEGIEACIGCGWWLESRGLNGDGLCEQCADDEL